MKKIIYENKSEEKIIKIVNSEAYVKYKIDNFIKIIDIKCDDNELSLLIDKLVVLTYYLELDYVYFGNLDFSRYHFEKVGECYLLKHNDITIRRFVKVGTGKTGKKNNICDVDDVKVGHFSINEKDYNTGVTVISPHSGNIFKEKVVAASYSFNGFGKSIGFLQVDELGSIESNIAFTSTLNVGKICEAVVAHSLDMNPEIGVKTGTINPIVMECNDGSLNKSRDRILGRQSYKKALSDLSNDFLQGTIGAGSGMICHGFKGGIGSASRIIELDGKEYTIGVILNSNFGENNGKMLVFNNHFLGDKIEKYLEDTEDKGSIVCVLATDLPVNDRQLRRMLKRLEIGIGKTGSYAGNGSGDVFIGFSTKNKINHVIKNAVEQIERLNEGKMNACFSLVVECVEEAVLNSMLFSKHVNGFLKEVKALGEINEIFYDYLDEVIEYKRGN